MSEERKEYWDNINTVLKYSDDVRKAKDDIHIKFQERLLLVATSVFAILVAFHSKNVDSSSICVFISAIISLSVCILSGAVALYGFLAAFKILSIETNKWVNEYIELPKRPRPLMKISGIFKISEWIFYISFVVSIILLASYAILSLTS